MSAKHSDPAVLQCAGIAGAKAAADRLNGARSAGYADGYGDGLVEGWDAAMDALGRLKIDQPERVMLHRQRRELRRSRTGREQEPVHEGQD